MSKIDLRRMTRKFLMEESKDNYNVFTYIQALQETLKNFSNLYISLKLPIFGP